MAAGDRDRKLGEERSELRHWTPADDGQPPAELPFETGKQLMKALVDANAVRPVRDLDQGSVEVQQKAGAREQIMRWSWKHDETLSPLA